MLSLIDSTDPDIFFIFTTRDGDRITCKCQKRYSFEYQVSFYINDLFNRFDSFSNIATYQQLKDAIVYYLNNWF